MYAYMNIASLNMYRKETEHNKTNTTLALECMNLGTVAPYFQIPSERINKLVYKRFPFASCSELINNMQCTNDNTPTFPFAYLKKRRERRGISNRETCEINFDFKRHQT